MLQVNTRRPHHQDTYDLRDQIHHTDMHSHAEAANYASTDDEEHSVLEDDSDGEDREDFIDDDDDSSLSIPNESIDFDLVYSLHSFAATVDGQANVVKGDSLFLMDDSNSYWWLVRVLKTQEVGYIPAENIETPFERLARLNKHRNVDLASATQAEMNEGARRNGPKTTKLVFQPSLYVHRYLPAMWNEDEEEDPDIEWDDEDYTDEDPELMDDGHGEGVGHTPTPGPGPATPVGMEGVEDDDMGWDTKSFETARQKVQQEQERQRAEQEQREAQIRLQQQQAQQQQQLRTQTSRERLDTASTDPRTLSPSRQIDPLESAETRKVTVTPSIARESDKAAQRQEEEQKRAREEEAAAAEEASRKKPKGKSAMPPPVSSASIHSGGKLRKEPRDRDENEGKEKKKSSVFGKLFSRKDKERGKTGSIGSMDSSELGRQSDESGRSRGSAMSPDGSNGTVSPTTNAARQNQNSFSGLRGSSDSRPSQSSISSPSASEASLTASQLRQRDHEQQQLYSKYLSRSPATVPEAQSNYGLQTASAVMANTRAYSANSGLGPPTTQRQRPGSLILTPDVMQGAVPELNVIRVFAGKNLQTEATFKTVLLNSSITAEDLVKQAVQRFRIPAGDDLNDYYLTIKQVDGSSAKLPPTEKPLKVFESLVEAAMELPKVKRSSVGSISSIASNLSMLPSIKKLSMNDFTDDSAVKFYLNRHSENDTESSNDEHEGKDTLLADVSLSSDVNNKSQYLSVSASNASITSERFTSPSFRFALQLLIYPEDIPDDMVFDPMTEAIVFKHTLRERPQSGSSSTSSQQFRRKVFVFPKNITVAEVIEQGLERFGISEGVVDGGDEVEDKNIKRRSTTRVRYGLFISVSPNSVERELAPSSRVTDAYPKPPVYRAAPRFPEHKRRSVDSAQLLGSIEDVSPDDPVFILRRATSYRNSSSRHRTSAPLDEVALQKLHRESMSSNDPSEGRESPRLATTNQGLSAPTRQELIAAQRAAIRANQHALLKTQANSLRGVDLVLPSNAVLRSERHHSGDGMRYSYVEPDGEAYDISDIVQEEWQERVAHRQDVLDGADGERIERVLTKIKQGGLPIRDSFISFERSLSPASQYSEETARSRSTTPGSAGLVSRTPVPAPSLMSQASSFMTARTSSPQSRPGTVTPTAGDRRKPSVASVVSEMSRYDTPLAGYNSSPATTPTKSSAPRKLWIPKDDFGIDRMLAVIESGGITGSKPEKPALHPIEEMLFGRPLVLEELHPQVRDIYADAKQQLDDMDKTLDDYLAKSLGKV